MPTRSTEWSRGIGAYCAHENQCGQWRRVDLRSPRSSVLRWRGQPVFSAECASRVRRPIRIPQQFPGQKHEICFSSSHNLASFFRLRYEANGGGGNAGFAANALGEWNLVARCDWDFGVRHRSARTAVDQVHPLRLQPPGQFDALLNVPASLHPVRT